MDRRYISLDILNVMYVCFDISLDILNVMYVCFGSILWIPLVLRVLRYSCPKLMLRILGVSAVLKAQILRVLGT